MKIISYISNRIFYFNFLFSIPVIVYGCFVISTHTQPTALEMEGISSVQIPYVEGGPDFEILFYGFFAFLSLILWYNFYRKDEDVGYAIICGILMFFNPMILLIAELIRGTLISGWGYETLWYFVWVTYISFSQIFYGFSGSNCLHLFNQENCC